MPRGDNPNSRANLKPQNKRTKEEQRKIATQGGKASGVARRALKTFQELDAETTTDAERQRMLDVLKKRAEQGNLKAWELYANYMGMKPSEKISMTVDDEEAVSGLREAIQKRRKNGADKG